MADQHALVDLLGRAGKVFSLAGDLGRAFSVERQSEDNFSSPSNWNRHAPTFDQFSQALHELHEPMQHPPVGFAALAEQLEKAAKVERGIQQTLQSSADQPPASLFEFLSRFEYCLASGLSSDSRSPKVA